MRCSLKTMLLRSTLTALAVALLAAAPASAQTPTLTTPLNACYVVAKESQREFVEVNATGFSPVTQVDIYVDEILQNQTFTLLPGTLTGRVKAPFLEAGTRPFTLRIAEP